jgi:hypothetical protein
MKKRLILTLLSSLILLAACNDNSIEIREEKTNETVQASATPPESTEITVDKTNYIVGDTITVGDFEIVIKRVEFSDGEEQNRPSDGKSFANVYIHAKNNGDRPVPLSPSDFTFYDQTGAECSIATTGYFAESQLSDTKLDKGDEINANILYEMPISNLDFKVIYAPEFLNGEITIE